MFLKTLKVFFFLKYEETLGSILWGSLLKRVGVILLAAFAIVGLVGSLGYCAYFLGWVNNKEELFAAGVGILIALFPACIFLFVCVQAVRLFFRWIRDNWREARRIVHSVDNPGDSWLAVLRKKYGVN